MCFSFCSNGEPKSVLIAQTHRQKVILYLPSVVPSFVYLLLNCLRRADAVFRGLDCGTWAVGAVVCPEGWGPEGAQLNPLKVPTENTVSPPENCLPHLLYSSARPLLIGEHLSKSSVVFSVKAATPRACTEPPVQGPSLVPPGRPAPNARTWQCSSADAEIPSVYC